MAYVQPHPQLLHFLNRLPAQIRKAPGDLPEFSGLAAACGKGVPPAPGKARAPDAQIVKDPQKSQITAQRIQPLQRQQHRGLLLPEGLLQFSFPGHDADPVLHRLQILPESRDLPQGSS